MNILILQDQLRIGGTEKQSLLLARVFRREGHEVTLVVFRPGGHLMESEDTCGPGIKVLQPFNSGVSFWAPRLMKTIGRLAPGVILCMGRTANCYAGFIQKRYPDIPVVGTLRTGKTLFPLHHWSMGRVRGVLANSNWWERRLLERKVPPERIHVVHNAVLLERPEEERYNLRRSTREKYAIEPDECIFLNVATFRPGKRHIDLLRMFRELRTQSPELSWRLWFVGDGREYRRCKRWVAENGLGTRVRFFHFQDDPFPFYAAGDVAVSASMEDSLPNFLVEAQATGLPVVAFDCRGVKETCIPGRTGEIIPPGSQEAFIETLRRFAGDPACRRRYGEQSPEFARKSFSREPQAKAVLAFLQDLAGEN